MLQLKVFYNVSFPEGERCEVIFTDQSIQSFEELMEVVRGKIECLRFIPDYMLGGVYMIPARLSFRGEMKSCTVFT